MWRAAVLELRFEDATAWVVKNGADLPTAVALELYGLFKQATCGREPLESMAVGSRGDCRDRRPLGFRGAAKWDAWKKLEGCPEELAKASYALSSSLRARFGALTLRWRPWRGMRPSGKAQEARPRATGSCPDTVLASW